MHAVFEDASLRVVTCLYQRQDGSMIRHLIQAWVESFEKGFFNAPRSRVFQDEFLEGGFTIEKVKLNMYVEI